MQATFFSGFSDTSEALDFMLENIHSNFQIGNKVFLNLDNSLLAKFEDLKRKKFQILKFMMINIKTFLKVIGQKILIKH